MVDSTVGHNRMIFCCSWSHDDKYFVTGSRDTKAANVCTCPICSHLIKAKVWTIGEDKKLITVSPMLFKSPVSAAAFAPVSVQNV